MSTRLVFLKSRRSVFSKSLEFRTSCVIHFPWAGSPCSHQPFFVWDLCLHPVVMAVHLFMWERWQQLNIMLQCVQMIPQRCWGTLVQGTSVLWTGKSFFFLKITLALHLHRNSILGTLNMFFQTWFQSEKCLCYNVFTRKNIISGRQSTDTHVDMVIALASSF